MNQGVPEEVARFAAFFKQATDHDPYPFQKRLATGEQLPELIDVPTGKDLTATCMILSDLPLYDIADFLRSIHIEMRS